MTELLDATRFLALRAGLADVYRAVFGRAPWSEPPAAAQAFADRLPDEAGQPGFRAVVARDGGGTLTGFGYGYLTPSPFPTGRSYDSVRAAVGDRAADTLSGTFEVLELAVRPDAHGQGTGRSMLTALVADRPAWLLTATFAPGAVAFYDRCGWKRLGEADDIVVYGAPAGSTAGH
ncbi:GNAT family N-acetyltransferase [Dactylosporangium aurantiacum]|uniref:GNAT family N-acetyltransferase n=2 Tax=Dactylosporangium aurantiacum TaxID=35754 RepID=A0A9Q9MLL9_9ACTN|nr:GNAT family N-acetyltransferase [Dactylosporangium aurantiacum]UWZ59125.1 GNAT family N-acetyltransferase [Dactylosporangium aurantiacum]